MADFKAAAKKRPGALATAVGGPFSANLAKVRELAKNGTPQEKKEALFYLDVLRKAGQAKKQTGKRLDEIATGRIVAARDQLNK